MYKKIGFGILVILVIVVIVVLMTAKKHKPAPSNSKNDKEMMMQEMKLGSTPLKMDEFKEYQETDNVGPVLNPFDHPPPYNAMDEMSNFEDVNGNDFYTYQRDRVDLIDTDRYE